MKGSPEYPPDLLAAGMVTIIFLLLFLPVAPATAADGTAPGITWQKCLGGSSTDILRSIAQTGDGGYILAGNTNSTDGDVTGRHNPTDTTDIWVVKTDGSGSIVWQKCLGGSDNETSLSIVEAGDGFILTGQTRSTDGNISGHHGSLPNYDVWVAKLAWNGTLLWQECLGGSSDDSGQCVRLTGDGGFVLVAYTLSTDGNVTGHHGSSENQDIWVVKLDSAGKIEWQRCLGGSDSDMAYSILQTSPDNGYALAGCTRSTDGNVTGNHGINDYWVVKLDPSGNLTWQKCLGGTNSDFGQSILQDEWGDYVVGGYSASTNGNVTGVQGDYDFWIVKLDGTGSLVWERSLGGTGPDYSFGITETAGGGYVAIGGTKSTDGNVTGHHGTSSNNDVWIAQLDSGGSLAWEKCLGGSLTDTGWTILRDQDKGLVVGAFTMSVDGDVSGHHGDGGVWDMWVVKIWGPPAVSGMRPLSGNRGTKAMLTISGENFQPGTTAFLTRTGAARMKLRVKSVVPDRVKALVHIPKSAVRGKWDLTVKMPDGQTVVRPRAFRVK